ncbi:hypothetical protein DID88_008962 [Monilinia fructigena]|uniref:Mitochondrial carrier protein n=1 Tax=Monilinia fructigena TaxID=38457 RepID=A0A395J9F0_9HELO|nr:hypothetical protein DID88_008962 [Monilinia fructigena]
MSGLWDSRPSSAADQLSTDFEPDHLAHDRIHGDDLIPGVSGTVAMTGDNEDIDITASQKMISAMSGSLLTSLLVTPLDVVRHVAGKSSLQAALQAMVVCAAPRISAIEGVGCAVEEIQRKTFNSTFDGMRKIARNEGITTLWRGLSPTLVMTVPSNIIYFTGYDWLRFNNQSPINRMFHDNYAPLAAGASARTISAAVVSPIEMFRTRMQASQATGEHISRKLSRVWVKWFRSTDIHLCGVD